MWHCYRVLRLLIRKSSTFRTKPVAVRKRRNLIKINFYIIRICESDKWEANSLVISCVHSIINLMAFSFGTLLSWGANSNSVWYRKSISTCEVRKKFILNLAIMQFNVTKSIEQSSILRTKKWKYAINQTIVIF